MTVAPENGTLRKKRSSSNGSVRRDSHTSSETSAASPSAKQPTISGEDQPATGPSMIPNVTEASTSSTSTCPTGSIRRGRAALDSGTKSAASTIAATPTGTLIQKIDRQPSPATST